MVRYNSHRRCVSNIFSILFWVSFLVLALAFAPPRRTVIHRQISGINRPSPDLHPAHVVLRDSYKGKQSTNRILTVATSWIAPVILSVLVTLSAAPSPAIAFDYATVTSVFTNDYEDPLHPECRRHIQVNPDGKTFHYSGTAVGPKDDDTGVLRGCSPQEIKQFGLRKGSFDGTLLEGNRISAGDGIHEGVWEPAGSIVISASAASNSNYLDVDSIRWNDGNKWIVKEKSLATKVGEVITFSYIGFSCLAGVIGLNKMYQKKMSEPS